MVLTAELIIRSKKRFTHRSHQSSLSHSGSSAMIAPETRGNVALSSKLRSQEELNMNIPHRPNLTASVAATLTAAALLMSVGCKGKDITKVGAAAPPPAVIVAEV